MSDYPVCPDCQSENVEANYEDESLWKCMDCGCRFPKEARANHIGYSTGEDDEEEEMDGGIGEDLFGEDW